MAMYNFTYIAARNNPHQIILARNARSRWVHTRSTEDTSVLPNTHPPSSAPTAELLQRVRSDQDLTARVRRQQELLNQQVDPGAINDYSAPQRPLPQSTIRITRPENYLSRVWWKEQQTAPAQDTSTPHNSAPEVADWLGDFAPPSMSAVLKIAAIMIKTPIFWQNCIAVFVALYAARGVDWLGSLIKRTLTKTVRRRPRRRKFVLPALLAPSRRPLVRRGTYRLPDNKQRKPPGSAAPTAPNTPWPRLRHYFVPRFSLWRRGPNILYHMGFILCFLPLQFCILVAWMLQPYFKFHFDEGWYAYAYFLAHATITLSVVTQSFAKSQPTFMRWFITFLFLMLLSAPLAIGAWFFQTFEVYSNGAFHETIYKGFGFTCNWAFRFSDAATAVEEMIKARSVSLTPEIKQKLVAHRMDLVMALVKGSGCANDLMLQLITPPVPRSLSTVEWLTHQMKHLCAWVVNHPFEIAAATLTVAAFGLLGYRIGKLDDHVRLSFTRVADRHLEIDYRLNELQWQCLHLIHGVDFPALPVPWLPLMLENYQLQHNYTCCLNLPSLPRTQGQSSDW